MADVKIIEMIGRCDERGRSMAIPEEAFEFLGGVVEMHIAELVPGAVRGNHWHDNRNEVLVVQGEDKFQFAWAKDKGMPGKVLSFDAGSFVAILIPQMVCHGIKNCGDRPIWVTAIADGSYDGVTPDTYAKNLI